jgi:hypothetical protein
VGRTSIRLTGASILLFPASGRRRHEGHAQGGLVHEHAVGRLAVLSQPLSMIRGDQDHAPLQAARLAPSLEDLAHHAIGVGDLSVVARAVAGALRLRRPVGGVGIEEVHPGEERLARGLGPAASAAPPPPPPPPAARRRSGRRRRRSRACGRRRWRSPGRARSGDPAPGIPGRPPSCSRRSPAPPPASSRSPAGGRCRCRARCGSPGGGRSSGRRAREGSAAPA